MQNGKIDKIWEILGSVPDPEIPVISVVELCVIRDVQLIDKKQLIRKGKIQKYLSEGAMILVLV